jgi:cyanophycin synthetase
MQSTDTVDTTGQLSSKLRVLRNFVGPSVFCPRRALWLTFTLPTALRQTTAPALAAIDAALAHQGAAWQPLQVPASGDRPLPAGAAIAALAIGLQRWVGHEVAAFARPQLGATDAEHLVLEYQLAEVALSAANLAVEIVSLAEATRSDRVAELLRAFKQRQASNPLPDFIAAAQARGIPWRPAVAQHPVYELGQGHKLRRLWRHFTPATPHLATVMATHKHMASAVLRANGLPAPQNQLVNDADAAVHAAHGLGWPVVVKPDAADYGTAVSVGLRSDDAVRRAFAAANQHGKVLVEQMIEGHNHRLLVMFGRFVSAGRQTPAQVVGDGQRNIKELVERANLSRDDRLGLRWKKITLDEQAEAVLADQHLGVTDVAASGQVVRLRYPSNLSAGGTMDNVAAIVHPDNQALAVRAAAVMGLDVAGVDFISTDITRSHFEVGGAICEINATPSFTIGEAPGWLPQLYLEGLFAAGDDGRVPTIVVVDERDDAHRAPLLRALEALLLRCWPRLGVATAGCARVGAQTLLRGQRADTEGAAILLAEPQVQAVLLAMRAEQIVEHGLAFDRCTLALWVADEAHPGVTPLPSRDAAARLLGSVAARVLVNAHGPAFAEQAQRAQVRRLADVSVEALTTALASALVRADAGS